MLPPEPAPAIRLPAVRLPEMLAVPVILAPVPVITSTLALPVALILTLPLADGMLTFELPLASIPVTLPTTLPTKVVAINAPFARLAEIAAFICNG